ncbi:hypothetical protein [Leclercia adecarboxylata]|uniref:hypothetical protein n=1 Tax=Leclercia adecarboxylata TaxID=83655 RepID=UPI00301808BA
MMVQELKFSLSYEQLFQEAEDQIKRCDLRQGDDRYVQELTKAHNVLHFWHSLVMRGYPGLPDVDRVNGDFKRLASLMKLRPEDDA